MRKTNKGFTLVELILSITVFAIVMVGIISIMSSTLKAYSRANLDVSVQEDCQIVANQLEEILCDAYEISGTGLSTGLTVKAKTTVRDDSGALSTQDNTYVITYVNANPGVDKADITVTMNGGTSYVLAENVTDFRLRGWVPGTNYTGASDNRTYIDLSMDLEGSTYSINRAVYFRNSVETGNFHDIQYLVSTTPGPSLSGDPHVKQVEIKRYETINLSAEYGILYGAALYKYDGTNFTTDSTASTYFTLTKTANFPGVTYTPGYNVESNAQPVTVTVTTGSVINGNFNNPLGGNKYAVVGYADTAMTEAGKVAVVFDVKPVAISNQNVISCHNGSNGTVNGEGFTCPISVDGIDVNECIKAGKTVKTKFEIKKNGSNDTIFDERSIGSSSGVIDLNSYKNNKSSGSQVEMGIAPDPYNGGLFVIFNNFGMQYLSDPGNLTLSTHITIDGNVFNNEFKLDRLDTTL